MADEASILSLYRTVDAALGPVTALVNNAGTPGPISGDRPGYRRRFWIPFWR